MIPELEAIVGLLLAVTVATFPVVWVYQFIEGLR